MVGPCLNDMNANWMHKWLFSGFFLHLPFRCLNPMNCDFINRNKKKITKKQRKRKEKTLILESTCVKWCCMARVVKEANNSCCFVFKVFTFKQKQWKKAKQYSFKIFFEVKRPTSDRIRLNASLMEYNPHYLSLIRMCFFFGFFWLTIWHRASILFGFNFQMYFSVFL